MGEEASPLLFLWTALHVCWLGWGSHPGKVWGFVTGENGNCAQDGSLMASFSILSFARLVLGLSVSENPEKGTWQLSY